MAPPTALSSRRAESVLRFSHGHLDPAPSSASALTQTLDKSHRTKWEDTYNSLNKALPSPNTACFELAGFHSKQPSASASTYIQKGCLISGEDQQIGVKLKPKDKANGPSLNGPVYMPVVLIILI